MEITDIKIHIFEPGKVFSIGFGQQLLWDTWASGLIRILTDEGIEGDYIASAGALEEFARRLAANKEDLIGADPFEREKIDKLLALKYRWPNAILCVLDVCLWDIIGKTLKLPIYKLLGGYREKILAYASGVEPAIGKRQEDHVKLAVECRDKGCKAFKIHPPHQDWRKDIALCKAVREAVGDEMILLMDSYSHEHYDREAALKVGKAIEKLDFYWYEDPLPTTDINGLADLCRSLDIKVLMGEYVSSICGYTELIRRQATDSLRCIDGLAGGITAMMKVAHLAEAFNMKCEPHSYGNTLAQAAHLHVMLAIKNCDFFELPVPEGIFDNGVKDVIRIDKDGYVHAPKKPGLGYDIDWDEVKKVTIRIPN